MTESVQSRRFFLAVLIGSLVLGAILLRPLALAIIFGAFAALIARPVHRRIMRKMGTRKAAGLTLLAVFLILAVPLFLVGWMLYREVLAFVAAIQQGQGYVIMDQLQQTLWPERTAEERAEFTQQTWGMVRPWLLATLQGLVSRAAITFGQALLGLTIAFFVIYYALVDGGRFRGYVSSMAPLPQRQLDYLFDETSRDLNAIFRGQILTSLVQGALGGIGFAIAGIPAPALWALVMTVLSLLPLVGPFMVWIPAAIYLFVTGHIGMGIFLTIWGALVVSQVDNFLRPHLIGARSGLHPLAVLLGVLGGVAAFGFVGLFLGPLIMGVIESVLKVWRDEYRNPGASESPPL